jgi:hypothetical protein
MTEPDWTLEIQFEHIIYSMSEKTTITESYPEQ